ncbi:MAG: CocE/NonD family hydrolase [Promethearchaeota archaeon]|nr:MAG: CocE/NonD family hydrolase [Candidatus Lokiarchaeota archaeon]
MNKKILALVLSSVVIFASGITVGIIYLSSTRYRYIPSLDWSFPQNCTFHQDYVSVPYMIPMRDGVGLATNVHIPRDIDQPLPIVLFRTPYNKNGINPEGLVSKGYIVVSQDTRGFHESDGEKGFPFAHDQMDGHDTLRWLEKQPWSDKKIGTQGGSALGITQYLMGPNAPTSLKCQTPVVGTPDLFKAMFEGGELRYELLVPWMQATGYSENTILSAITNDTLTSVWDPVRIVNDFEQVNTASLHFGGWYDIFAQDTIDGFMGYQYEGGLLAKGTAKLIMGPWRHGNFYGGPTGEIEFPNQNIEIATYAQDAVIQKWLKNDPTLWDQYPTVLYYVMSSIDYNSDELGNHWSQSDSWPIPINVTSLFLASTGDPHSGSLSDISVDSAPSEILYDPGNPTDTIGGNNLVLAAGTYDQTSLESREDVLLFETSDLLEPVTVVGKTNITFYFSSNCTDTDITVKLTDVYPDGRSMLICDSILRLRYRNGISSGELMTPGTIYEITIQLPSTTYVFNEAHKIRLAISGSNYPRYFANPNTGEPIWQNTTYYIAENTFYSNSTHPSVISLPTPEYTSLMPFVF